jgi:hypothetical protein
MRTALGQCGENSTRVPDAARFRRCQRVARMRAARAWVQVTLFQHTPAVPRGFAIRPMTYQDPRWLASVPIPVFLACISLWDALGTIFAL